VSDADFDFDTCYDCDCDRRHRVPSAFASSRRPRIRLSSRFWRPFWCWQNSLCSTTRPTCAPCQTFSQPDELLHAS
jgi:hypothetical protein